MKRIMENINQTENQLCETFETNFLPFYTRMGQK